MPEAADPSRSLRGWLAPIGLTAAAVVLGVLLSQVPLPRFLFAVTAAPTPTEASIVISPSPAGSPGVGDKVLAGFWRVIEADDLSYHLSASGKWTVTSGSQTVIHSFTLELDLSGDDYAGTVDIAADGGKYDIIRKGGVLHRRPGTSGAWTQMSNPDPGLVQTPFMALVSHQDIGYATAIAEPIGTIHRLVTTGYYAPYVPRLLEMGSFPFTADVVALDLFVTTEGVPLRATFHCEAHETGTATPVTFEGTGQYAFTKFGTKFSIKAP